MFKMAGTPGYMAPEQINGEELTPACDVYALGIMLFVMLVGDQPHRKRGVKGQMDILQFQLDGKLPSIREFRPDVPPEIDALYRYCTAAPVSQRYQSIAAFLPLARQWSQALAT
jgi:serine/threonine-protein kinase